MDTSNIEVPIKGWYDVNPDIEKSIESVCTTPMSKRKKVGTGYTWDGKSKWCYPVEDIQKKIINLVADVKYKKSRSLRDAQAQLNKELQEQGLPPVTTAGGLSNLLKRTEIRLGLVSEEETTAGKLKKVRNERLEKNREEGKPREYHYSKPIEKKLEIQKRLTQKNKELATLKEKEKRLKASAAKAAARLKLKGDPTKDISKEPKKDEKSEIESDAIPQNREIAFMPNPGPQTDFLSSDEDIVLYGGAAGGGK